MKKALEDSAATTQTLTPTASGGVNTVSDDDASLNRQLEENNKAMEDMKLSYEEKLKKAQEQARLQFSFRHLSLMFKIFCFEKNSDLASTKIIKKSKTMPHLRNVNMDSMLSGKIRHLLDGEGVKKIGSDPKSDIVLGGIK